MRATLSNSIASITKLKESPAKLLENADTILVKENTIKFIKSSK
jgi:hypothetical protein